MISGWRDTTPLGGGFPGIVCNATTVRVRADLQGDNPGDPPDRFADDKDEDLTYSYQGPPNNRILRDDANDALPAQTMAENIETLDFDCLANQIVVTITARTAGVDPNYHTNGGYRTYTLTSVITPRNLAL